MIVVSDTSPLCYLLLIDLIDLLPQLYGRVIIPQTVQNELAASKSPTVVQNWIAQPPSWLEVQAIANLPDLMLDELDLGEQEAILLAEELRADLILFDDRVARQVASQRGLEIVGVLGILVKAAQRDMVDFPTAIARLQQTTFRASASLIQSLLQKFVINESDE
jgi:predicted nucleic acid-binding protein